MGEGSLLPSLTFPKSSYLEVGKEGSGLQTLTLALRTTLSELSDGQARRWPGRHWGAESPPPQLGELVWRGRLKAVGEGERGEPAETQVASRSVGQKLEGDLCMGEAERGPWGRDGF